MIKADYIICGALLLMMLTHGTTHYLIAKYTSNEMVAGEVKAFIELREANPLASLALQFEKAKIVYSVVLAPSIILGTYFYMRRRYIEKEEVFELFATTTALAFGLNFFNDASILMGFLAR